MASSAGPPKSALKKTSKYGDGSNSENISFGPGPSSLLETHFESNEHEEADGLTKREKLQIMIGKKKEADARAKEIVYNLIETNVEKSYLLESAGFISTVHWDDIVEERKLSKICGWVLCDNELTNIPKQQFSIRNKKVVDITERKSFCSSHCYAVADHFKKQLLISPLWMRDKEEIPEFQILKNESKQLHGIEVSLNKLGLEDDDDEGKGSDDDTGSESDKDEK